LLLSLAITFALWFQYNVGPGIVTETGWVWKTYRAIPGTGKLIFNAWKHGCENYQGDFVSQCAGNAGVYRPMFLAFLFFVLSAFATHWQPHLNRESWPAKYTIFLFALFFTMFIPNSPIFSGFFLWTSRIGATIFVVLQQVILIDVAYNWNDDWVEKSNEADRISYGSGSGWLQAIIGMCVLMYTASIVGIGILYHLFDGCAENTWIITLTLLGILAMTGLQVAGRDGSLLTSSVMSLYSVYLCFSVVSKNPNGSCNPRLGHNDVSGIVIGLTLTAVSLAWTGWAWSAEQRLSVDA
jgi:serine incorporator 1/3